MRTFRYSIPALLLFFFFTGSIASAQKADPLPHADVIIKTKYGDIGLILFLETPLHRANFIKLAKEKFFDQTVFHRVITGFMIQGGDPWSKDKTRREEWGNGGPDYDLPAEIRPEFFHVQGMLAAAREGDDVNPERKSSGSQFYIVTGKVITEEKMLKAESRVQEGTGNPDFHFTDEQKNAYQTVGGAPWLDQQYTIFGKVVYGMEVAQKIELLQLPNSDKPSKEIKIKVRAMVKE
jgi:cyclophilin family peptidyl-prolyl cis-trans isomerase